jgi:hypothetical protein
MNRTFQRTARYEPRRLEFMGVLEFAGGWRLKAYSILCASGVLDEPAHDEGFTRAASMLPRPAESASRPGVGFVILHQGRGVVYLVLGWWDNENELPLRVLVREATPGADWRAAAAHESVCVWDLRVLWHEREAYVRHVLGPERGPDIEGYLLDALASGTW